MSEHSLRAEKAERERDAVTASLKVVIDAAEHTTFWPSAPKDPLHLAISEARRFLESLSSAGNATGVTRESASSERSGAPKAEDNPPGKEQGE